MNETLQKINSMVKVFNNTFEIKPKEVIDTNEEEMANGLEITNIKNDGTEFIDEMMENCNE
jgi:hypothetical protein